MCSGCWKHHRNRKSKLGTGAEQCKSCPIGSRSVASRPASHRKAGPRSNSSNRALSSILASNLRPSCVSSQAPHNLRSTRNNRPSEPMTRLHFYVLRQLIGFLVLATISGVGVGVLVHVLPLTVLLGPNPQSD
jgi:hypothetical protein